MRFGCRAEKFLPLTLREWNGLAAYLAEELEGLEAPAAMGEAELVRFGAAELERRYNRRPKDERPSEPMFLAGGRVWAADAITARCERLAMSAPDFDGEQERKR